MSAERVGEAGKTPLYVEIAARIGSLIDRGTYLPGDRIPSIRELSRQMRVSVSTVMEAYAQLENARAVEARPQSGYYVCSRLAEPEPRPTKRPGKKEFSANPVKLGDVPWRVIDSLSDPSLVPLGRCTPNPELLPARKLNLMLGTQARRFPLDTVARTQTAGSKRLRRQIARRALEAGCSLYPEEIVITSGCVEAVTLALQATCRSGDTVAIGSPIYFPFLNRIQWMGLKVLEIPSSPREGMDLAVLGRALRQRPIHACISIPNFDNPLGSLMPDEKKRELVALLARHEVPLIEDDVYGDLAFGPARPSTAKAYDRRGLVILCSSFSKTLAPGYRVGWIVPGRFQQKVERLKFLFNIATASPTQLAVAEFLTNGGYDRHLRTIRRTYARQVEQVRESIGHHFPRGTRVTRPEGGFTLWVEVPNIDALRLYEDALRAGISIVPGSVFTTGSGYRNCLRVSGAFWSEAVEAALETLGGLAKGEESRAGPTRGPVLSARA